MAVVFTIGLIAFVDDRLTVYRFRRQFRGRYILVSTTRDGWHDFIVNNVVPVLPEGSAVEWTRSRHVWRPVLAALRALHVQDERPLLVYVGKRVRGVSLKENLLPLRANVKKDPETQRRVAEIVAAAQRVIT